jgi:hypothetical protein
MPSIAAALRYLAPRGARISAVTAPPGGVGAGLRIAALGQGLQPVGRLAADLEQGETRIVDHQKRRRDRLA